MNKTTVRFEVEHAGCPACAERVQGALASLGTVEQITIDKESDTATVSVSAERAIAEDAVNRALGLASTGSGHDYRVKGDSWTASL